ncbi:MAG: hypothetical protein JNJ41_02490 [Bacteroidia bacterium]|nr:hypothetical protein [Bacteroidia bacterium]
MEKTLEMQWHVYDLDLNRALRQAITQIERKNYVFKKNPFLSDKDFIDNMKTTIKVYCEHRGLDSNHYLNNSRAPLLVSYEDEAYESYLSFCLVAYDVPKIGFFLDYQKQKYAGKENFVNLIEFIIYEYIKENSAFDLEARLNKICDWVEKQKATNLNKKGVKLKKIKYSEILKALYEGGLDVEKNPSLYINKHEEEIRDVFKYGLKGGFKNLSITGETKNAKGKTDILITQSDGTNIFVGEWKVWSGEKLLLEAITQVLNNGSANDSCLALIVLVKKKGFVDIVKKIKKIIPNHPQHKEFVKDRETYSFSYKFSRPTDKNNIVSLEVMAFHCDLKSAKPAKKGSSKKSNLKPNK